MPVGPARETLAYVGFRGPVRRSTFADANQDRDWRIYAEFASAAADRTGEAAVCGREPVGGPEQHRLRIGSNHHRSVSLALFPWAHFRSTKAAVKMHTLLDLRGNIPSFIHISDGKLHDVHALDMLVPEAGAICVMDRGYADFARLHRLHQAGAFFVTRAKSNLKAHRVYSGRDRSHDRRHRRSNDRAGWALYEARLPGASPGGCVSVGPKTGKTLVFLTNMTAQPALTICDLYKSRWQVELFFKWIKQHLRIKAFYGTSENAVKAQIWIAVSVYVLVAIIRKRLKLDALLYTLMQVFSVTVFEKAYDRIL